MLDTKEGEDEEKGNGEETFLENPQKCPQLGSNNWQVHVNNLNESDKEEMLDDED